MDSVPFLFCEQVARQLGEPKYLKKFGRIWRSAAKKDASRRYSFQLTLKPTDDADIWIYNFCYWAHPQRQPHTSLQDFAKLDNRHIHVIRIVIENRIQHRNRWPPATQYEDGFFRISIDKILSELLPQTRPYMNHCSGLRLSVDYVHSDAFDSILRYLTNHFHFQTLDMKYCGKESQNLLAKHVEAGTLMQITLDRDWSQDVVYTILKAMPQLQLTNFSVTSKTLKLDRDLLLEVLSCWRRGYIGPVAFGLHFELPFEVTIDEVREVMGDDNFNGKKPFMLRETSGRFFYVLYDDHVNFL